MVEPFLDNMTLQEAISKKRIFIVDLTVLEKVDQDHPDKYKVTSSMRADYFRHHTLFSIRRPKWFQPVRYFQRLT